MKLLYAIPRMTHGGGMPNVLSEVKKIRQGNYDISATVVVLEPGISKDLMLDAIANGLKVLMTPSNRILARLIEAAQLTVLHYWNCPATFHFFKFLSEYKILHRLVVSLTVNGITLPQSVPAWVRANCELLITAHPLTPISELRTGGRYSQMPRFFRLPDQPLQFIIPEHKSFRLYYAGALNHFKTHPEFVGLHEGLKIPNYSFDIWGAGMDESFREDLAHAQTAVYRGFSHDIYHTIATYHLLCNPQTELSYGSFDKIMWESQWVGKPVIVLKDSYIASHIVHDVNGLVAEDETSYRSMIEDLAGRPGAYQKLSESTFEHIREHYKPDSQVEELTELYQMTIEKEPKVIEPESVPSSPEAAVLDGMGKWREAIVSSPRSLSRREIQFALRCEGGLIHYAKAYPDSAPLRVIISELLRIEQMSIANA